MRWVVGILRIGEEWFDEPLPIADYIDLDHSTGKWIAALHRHGRPECEKAVPRCEQLAGSENAAAVEVPLFGTHTSNLGHGELARLREDREWFVQTPVEMRKQDGVVVSASAELPSLLSTKGL